MLGRGFLNAYDSQWRSCDGTDGAIARPPSPPPRYRLSTRSVALDKKTVIIIIIIVEHQSSIIHLLFIIIH